MYRHREMPDTNICLFLQMLEFRQQLDIDSLGV